MNPKGDFKICSKTVMDTSTSLIEFDTEGISNFYYEFQNLAAHTIFREKSILEDQLNASILKMKSNPSKDGYHCLLGLSGGVDSTYLAYLCHKFGLNPLCVHFDNGWNTELAVQNIYAVINKYGYDLQTFIVDWIEFSDLQKSFFKASVMDLEVPTDQFIFGTLNKVAKEFGIKFILSGNNVATESILPKDWRYDKFDSINLKTIHNKFGEVSIKSVPFLGKFELHVFKKILKIEQINLLDLLNYKKQNAIEIITSEIGWRNYGGKHHESIFTRWFQGYYLPIKFNIDKRKAHLSNLILNGEITRDSALAELENPPYDLNLQKSDFEYVAKKWEIPINEFTAIFNSKPISHLDYDNDKTRFHSRIFWLKKKVLTFPLTIYYNVFK